MVANSPHIHLFITNLWGGKKNQSQPDLFDHKCMEKKEEEEEIVTQTAIQTT